MSEPIDELLHEDDDAIDEVLAVIDEVLAEHPEYEPACTLILQKLNERMKFEIETLRHAPRITPGPEKPQ